jgi:hypothetical protein
MKPSVAPSPNPLTLKKRMKVPRQAMLEQDAVHRRSAFTGNKLAGSVGLDESEQDSFGGGKLDGDKLTFDVPQGTNGEGSVHVEL